jgi:hypothetical protein
MQDSTLIISKIVRMREDILLEKVIVMSNNSPSYLFILLLNGHFGRPYLKISQQWDCHKDKLNMVQPQVNYTSEEQTSNSSKL